MGTLLRVQRFKVQSSKLSCKVVNASNFEL
jgi:hypothetical protein